MREYPRITPILRQLVLCAPNGLPAKAPTGRRPQAVPVSRACEAYGNRTQSGENPFYKKGFPPPVFPSSSANGRRGTA